MRGEVVIQEKREEGLIIPVKVNHS
jgi:hypothetical protein